MTDRHVRALGLINTADSLRQQGRVEASIEAAREAIRLMESARDEGNQDDARQLHAAYGVLAVTLAQCNRDEESIPWFEKALASYEEENPYGGDHRAISQLASLRHNFAAALTTLDPQQSDVQLDMALALKEKLLAEHPDMEMYKVNLVRTYLSVANQRSGERAMRSLNRSFALLNQLLEEKPQQVELLGLMAQCASQLGKALQHESLDQAIHMYSLCLSALQRAAGSATGLPYPLFVIWVQAQTDLADCLMRREEYDNVHALLKGALTIATTAIERAPDLKPEFMDVAHIQMQLGRYYGLAGEPDKGIAIATELAASTDDRCRYYAARVYCVCAPRTDRPAQFRDIAMRLLHDCGAAGYFNTQALIDTLRRESDFASLRDTVEFGQLTERIESRLDARK